MLLEENISELKKEDVSDRENNKNNSLKFNKL